MDLDRLHLNQQHASLFVFKTKTTGQQLPCYLTPEHAPFLEEKNVLK